MLSTINKNNSWYFILVVALQCVIASCFRFPRIYSGITLQNLRLEQPTIHKGRHKNAHSWIRASYKDNTNDNEGNIESDSPRRTQKPISISNNTPPPLNIGQAMQVMGTSPRRIFLSIASSTGIALTANLFGVTSNIISQLPEEFSEQSGLDYVYPRDGFKRVTARSNFGDIGKCSFLIPTDWVADTGLALAQAQRQVKALDLTMRSNPMQGVLPDAAFGPPGRLDSQGLSNGDTNVSVIINSAKNFSLKESLGEPAAVAEKLISSQFRRPTLLLSAREIHRGQSPVYQFEYIVDRGEKALPLRATSVIAGGLGGTSYITLTVVSPSPEWDKSEVNEKLRKIVNS